MDPDLPKGHAAVAGNGRAALRIGLGVGADEQVEGLAAAIVEGGGDGVGGLGNGR